MSAALVSLGNHYCDGFNANETGGLHVWEFSYAANKIIPNHEHQKPYICFLLEGDAIETNARDDISYSRERLVYLPKGATHTGKIGPQGTKIFSFELDDDFFDDDVRTHYFPEHPTTIADRSLFAMLHVVMMMARNSEHKQFDQTWPYEIVAALLAIKPDRCVKWLNSVRDYIHEHAAENPSPTMLASIANRHPTHLMRAFRRHTGLTLGGYIQAVKIDNACTLIRKGEMSLTQIASVCGFADQSHFIRAFRNMMKTSPSKYRQAFR
jgi:AraC family transcriptional regulator